MMSFVAPSFNTSRQNLLEPVTLRGLGPDHLLILLNGIRYHNTTYVNNDAIRGTLGVGAVGNQKGELSIVSPELKGCRACQYNPLKIATTD